MLEKLYLQICKLWSGLRTSYLLCSINRFICKADVIYAGLMLVSEKTALDLLLSLPWGCCEAEEYYIAAKPACQTCCASAERRNATVDVPKRKGLLPRESIPVSYLRDLKTKSLILRLLDCLSKGTCTFTISNHCPYTIWPGTLGTPQLPMTGFELASGESIHVPSVPGWSGRIWARTGCTFDASGAGACRTGDCGGRLECGGIGATPPASLFEITIGQGDEKDFYDVSFVDGYNLPLVAAPSGVYGSCNATGCATDINIGCPKELQVAGEGEGTAKGVVACKSACEAFGLDQYCCSGEFANPTTCRPSFYSSIFKRACPSAYSYAFDDGTSTFTCKAFEYSIIFCPNANAMNQSNGTSLITSPSILKSSKKVPSHGHSHTSSGTIRVPFYLAFIVLLLPILTKT